MVKQEWSALMNQLAEAQERFRTGDASAYKALWSRAEDVVVMGGFGGYEKGWDVVGKRLDWAASQGLPAGDHFELLAEYVSETMGCLVGLLHYVDGRSLRVTELFRREGGDWRLGYRHADWLVLKGDSSVMS